MSEDYELTFDDMACLMARDLLDIWLGVIGCDEEGKQKFYHASGWIIPFLEDCGFLEVRKAPPIVAGETCYHVRLTQLGYQTCYRIVSQIQPQALRQFSIYKATNGESGKNVHNAKSVNATNCCDLTQAKPTNGNGHAK